MKPNVTYVRVVPFCVCAFLAGVVYGMDPTKKELYTAKRPSGLDTSDPSVQSIIDQLRSDSDPTNWILLKVVGTTLAVQSAGSGGLTELSTALVDDDVLYGALRCEVDGKVRFYHVFFVGTAVGAMKKGKASMYKSAVFSMIDAHGELTCTGGLEEYSQDLILSNIAKLAGSTNIVA